MLADGILNPQPVLQLVHAYINATSNEQAVIKIGSRLIDSLGAKVGLQ